MSELCFMPATRLARLLRARQVSATEVTRAFIAQIERVNPQVNAIVTFLPERALKQAKLLDKKKPAAEDILWGLPIAYKDVVPTKGIRTTFGSPIYRDHVPAEDHLIVERLSAAGAIAIGKTNTPEFAAGSQTFNAVFGATLNPYDLSRTCGGSSGGAAAAVACGMLPFADGSDLGASLRNPGNFCNVVGFRPSPGRVPAWPSSDAWQTMTVIGPLARTVADCALLFSAMAGPDPRDPTSIDETGKIFLKNLNRSFRKTRVAWSRDLGGLPVEPAVTEALQPHRRTLKELGCAVEDAEPDLAGADEAFHVLRAVGFVQKYGELLKTRRELLKPDVVWNIEQGLALDGARIARAQALRTEIFHRMRRFMQRYEFLCLPVNQVLPFPVTQPWVGEINGVKLGNYLDWMKTCYYITVTGHPAISAPAGFTPAGLPVGLQIVGRHRDDLGVLQLAHAFESATGPWRRRPPLTAVKE
ncbi:MAG: amidase [Betaproteobacteria bacterium]